MGALLLAVGVLLAAPAPLVVSVGGPPEDPAYLAVYAAEALGTFEAEGVRPTLRRAKHPTGAVDALRDKDAGVAVTTTDQAIRGAWARGTPVRILVAHTRGPAAALLVSVKHRDQVTGVQDLRGRRVGIPGPGTTGHLVLAALLRERRIEPWQLALVSLGGTALTARLASGDLAAALVEEPWTSRALRAGAADVLLDFRRPDDAARHLGGPFYEVVSVAPAAEPEPQRLEALEGYVRAILRVQAWLAATPAAAVAARLPRRLVADPETFVARLAAVQGILAPDGEATEAGLTATLRILRGGTPWPVTLTLGPADLREPPFVAAARARLGSAPPAP